MEKFVIGIDADSDKSGVAVVNKELKTVHVQTLSFFDLFDFLKDNKADIKVVKIECGYLNAKSSWHGAKSQAYASRIGKNVGQNIQTARLIVLMCEYLQIPYLERKPLKKIWKGKDGKITQFELQGQLASLGYTYSGKKNQDARDAILIALY